MARWAGPRRPGISKSTLSRLETGQRRPTLDLLLLLLLRPDTRVRNVPRGPEHRFDGAGPRRGGGTTRPAAVARRNQLTTPPGSRPGCCPLLEAETPPPSDQAPVQQVHRVDGSLGGARRLSANAK